MKFLYLFLLIVAGVFSILAIITNSAKYAGVAALALFLALGLKAAI